jgi:hypothetical protein
MCYMCGPFTCRCTHIFGIPSMYLDLICASQDLGLKVTTLQVACYGAAPCSQQMACRMKEILNVRRLVVSARLITMC